MTIEVTVKVNLSLVKGELICTIGESIEDAVWLLVLANLVSTFTGPAMSEVFGIVMGPGGGNSSKGSKGEEFHLLLF